ncbi:hypothetical protein SPFM8_00223 [Salmonella phage SPFM8]|nr:hypothetical protein SPFM8_00223 [Salmonella phage SPFM8]
MDIIRNPVGHINDPDQVTALSIAMGKTVSIVVCEGSFYLIFGSNEPVYATPKAAELAREYTGCIVPLTSIVSLEFKVEKKSVKGYVMEVP